MLVVLVLVVLVLVVLIVIAAGVVGVAGAVAAVAIEGSAVERREETACDGRGGAYGESELHSRRSPQAQLGTVGMRWIHGQRGVLTCLFWRRGPPDSPRRVPRPRTRPGSQPRDALRAAECRTGSARTCSPSQHRI